MPIIKGPSYTSPKMFNNGHIQTIYPNLFRKINDFKFSRERLNTPDRDFLDIDYSLIGSDKVVIMSHGLEGSTDTQYIRGMARHLNHRGFDTVAWNMRSCSGEINKLERFYHGGDTQDLSFVINHVLEKAPWKEVHLLGFSLGSNVTAKYVGERGQFLDSRISKCVLFSCPCDFTTSIEELSKPMNKVYLDNFLKTYRLKMKEKDSIIGFTKVDLKDIDRVKTFREFDDKFTAPLHGFKSADDLYLRTSCKPFLHNIRIPTLMINAKNDPFLGKDCYPIKDAHRNNNLYLEIPDSGGHLGFVSFDKNNFYWSELRASSFLEESFM